MNRGRDTSLANPEILDNILRFVTDHPARYKWSPETHITNFHCGQSCPCCRAREFDLMGTCAYCDNYAEVVIVSRNFKKAAKRCRFRRTASTPK